MAKRLRSAVFRVGIEASWGTFISQNLLSDCDVWDYVPMSAWIPDIYTERIQTTTTRTLFVSHQVGSRPVRK